MWNDGLSFGSKAMSDLQVLIIWSRVGRSRALCRTPFAQFLNSDAPQRCVAVPPASSHAMDGRLAAYTKTTVAALRVMRNRSPENSAEFGFGAGWRRKTASRHCRDV